jgi:hypothetical protein
MTSPYELLEVTWGEEVLYARPISWSKDLGGEDIDPENTDDVVATKFELVCPECGAHCTFQKYHITIMCDECESSTHNPLTPKSAMEIESEIINDEIDNISDDELSSVLDDLAGDPTDPVNVIDDLTKSMENSEIELESKGTKSKTKKSTKKKTNRKKTKKKTTKKPDKK